MILNALIIIVTLAASYDEYTTLVIRNIDKHLGSHVLIKYALDNLGATQYNLIYLPHDFDTKLNHGYAFVNFRNHQAAMDAWLSLLSNDHITKSLQWEKRISVSWARDQGFEQNIRLHCRPRLSRIRNTQLR